MTYLYINHLNDQIKSSISIPVNIVAYNIRIVTSENIAKSKLNKCEYSDHQEHLDARQRRQLPLGDDEPADDGTGGGRENVHHAFK